MAKRPAVAGNPDPRSDREREADEIAARDADGAPEEEVSDVETLPADGASDGAKAHSDPENDGTAKRPQYEEDPARAAIIESFKKSRGVSEDEDAGDDETGDEGEAKPAAVAEAAPEEPAKPDATKKAEPAAKPAPAAELSPDTMVKLKVDGVDIELPLSELTSNAQMNLAAEARLRAANELLDRVKSAVGDRKADQPPATERTAPSDEAPARKTKRTVEELLPFVDALQSESPEEAAAKLLELLNTVEQPASADQPDPAATARAVLLEDRAQEDVQRALADTAAKFPDIAASDDPDLPVLMFEKVGRAVVTNLKGIGYTDEELKAPMDQLIRHYAKVRRMPNYPDGRKLKPLDEVFTEVSQDVQDKYVAPRLAVKQPQPKTEPPAEQPRVAVTPERAERRTRTQTQPRSGSMRADMSKVGEPGKPADRSSIVQKMAQERGQPSAA